MRHRRPIIGSPMKARICRKSLLDKNTGGGGRTLTSLRTLDFESSASAIPPLRRVGILEFTSHLLRVNPLAKIRPGRPPVLPYLNEKTSRFEWGDGGPPDFLPGFCIPTN